MVQLRMMIAGILLSASAFAGTIVSRDASPFQVGYGPGWQAVSWTETATYTNVAVSALVGTTIGFQQSTGTAYLLNNLGPGTTAANQVAAPVAFTTGGSMQLFSGLTLGPGTYYLLIDSVEGKAGWGQTFYGGITEVLDSGVTNVLQYQPSGSVQAYSPATPFTSYDPKTTGNTLVFGVTGDRQAPPTEGAVPEPATCAMTLGGLAALLFVRRKK
jgi:hypothetical protein